MTLKDYLKQHKISYRKFALLVGVSHVTIGNWCLFATEPSIKDLIKIKSLTNGFVRTEDFINPDA